MANWKKSFNAIPEAIDAKLTQIKEDYVIVAATKKVKRHDVETEVYDHIGLIIKDDAVFAEGPVVPDESVGRTSAYNVNGREIVRKDLPKITKTFIWETPNFGDASTYGTHTHYNDREVYQRQIFEPRFLAIACELMSDPKLDTVLVKFSIEQIFDKKIARFQRGFAFCLEPLAGKYRRRRYF